MNEIICYHIECIIAISSVVCRMTLPSRFLFLISKVKDKWVEAEGKYCTVFIEELRWALSGCKLPDDWESTPEVLRETRYLMYPLEKGTKTSRLGSGMTKQRKRSEGREKAKKKLDSQRDEKGDESTGSLGVWETER